MDDTKRNQLGGTIARQHMGVNGGAHAIISPRENTFYIHLPIHEEDSSRPLRREHQHGTIDFILEEVEMQDAEQTRTQLLQSQPMPGHASGRDTLLLHARIRRADPGRLRNGSTNQPPTLSGRFLQGTGPNRHGLLPRVQSPSTQPTDERIHLRGGEQSSKRQRVGSVQWIRRSYRRNARY